MEQTAPRKFSTNYAYPWTLVLRGGAEEGKRPFTRLAFIREAVAEEGKIIRYRGWIGSDFGRLGAFTKHVRDIEPGEIVKEWRHRPSEAEIARAKRRLKPTPISPEVEAYRRQRRPAPARSADSLICA